MPKKCAFVDEEGVRCGTTPTYNNRGETKPLYCNTHRLDIMVNVIIHNVSLMDVYYVRPLIIKVKITDCIVAFIG